MRRAGWREVFEARLGASKQWRFLDSYGSKTMISLRNTSGSKRILRQKHKEHFGLLDLLVRSKCRAFCQGSSCKKPLPSCIFWAFGQLKEGRTNQKHRKRNRKGADLS